MKRWIVTALAVCVVPVLLVGCGAKKEESAQAAIQKSKEFESVEKQVDYLVDQAKKFYNSKEYTEAVNTAQHVLANLEKESEEAKAILEDAKEELAEQANKSVEDLKNAVKGMGK